MAISTRARIVEVATSLPWPPGLTSSSHAPATPTIAHGLGRRAVKAARASTAKPRWWVHEMGLTRAPAHPMMAVAASRSSRRAARTPRHRPMPTMTAALASHSAVRAWPGSTARDTIDSNELLAGSSTRPIRSELKMSSVQ